jgi:hypothetical protein
MMAKTKKLDRKLLVTIGVLLLVIAALAWFYTSQRADKPYSAVLLTSGDLYIGKVSYFPRLSIVDVYTIQAVTDVENPNQLVPQLVSMETSLWAAEKLYLNPEQVVFVGPVGEDSQVMQALAGQAGN